MAKRKSKKKNVQMKNSEADLVLNDSIGKNIFLIFCVVVFLLAFYLLTLYITNKNSDDKKDDTTEKSETSISYDKVAAGRSFSVKDGEYLVLYYDFSDEEVLSTYDNLVNTYSGKEEHLSIYKVDMSSGFNKAYVTTGESNKSPTKEEELSINGPTLIHINNHEVVDYIEGEQEITSYLS